MTIEDWAQIRRLRRVDEEIALELWVSRNAVRRAPARDAPPQYERPARGALVEVVESQVRALLAGCATMPATVIAQRIGWEHSLTIL